jgi:signal transduction histidine kinase
MNNMDKILDPAICSWDTAQFLIFSDNVFGDFIYYSHIFPALSALLLGLFIFLNNRKDLVTQLLFGITIVFALWSFFDLVLWATEKTPYTMFFWSSMIHLDLLLYVLSFYFVFAFLFQKLPDWRVDLITFIVFLPLVLFAHTNLNLVAFDFTNCWREAIEGPLWQVYVYNVEILISLAILVMGSFAIFKTKREERRKKGYVVAGILLFLLMFSAGNIAGSLNIDWELGQYGLFGMAILVAVLGYLIVKYKAFNITVLTSQILVAALTILIFSLLLIQKIENIRIIGLITLVLTVFIGLVLIRSNKNDLRQKEEIEKLAIKLEKANEQLKVLDKMKSEFVSIASHQLRSPLTSIRGYASMLLEGSFGPLPPKARDAVERITESSRFMASSVEDYLNVSRIQAGNMKYEYSDFNLKDLAERVADDTRQVAMKKGLLVLFRSDMIKKGIVHADIGKTKQVIDNLLNNAMKYTPKGSITVFVHDDPKKKKIFVDIIDTGIGMSPSTLENMFGKFERASNANEVNVTGTGLGLYIARKMAREMQGDVHAASEGEGKGSTFTIELPLHL